MKNQIEIIAEIGINHNGDMNKAVELIKVAKSSGADVAKFQLYDPRTRIDINEHPYKEILLKSRLTKRQVFILKDECDKLDIEFMASCFDPERVEWCEQIDMKRYKIASKSIYDDELSTAIYNTDKEVILSFGFYEIGKMASIMNGGIVFLDKIKRLYCISSYPTKLSQLIDFRQSDLFDTFDGFSDHTPGISASILAITKGAKIIEKHITLDRSLPGPDNCFSLEQNELIQLCQFRDDYQEIMLRDIKNG